MVAGIFALFLATGIGQDPLQFVHPPQEYVDLLLKNPPMLRLCLGLDNAFIVFYSTVFVLLGVVVSMGTLGLTGLLDISRTFISWRCSAPRSKGSA